jgi:2-dehydropantoate 2-reductase
MTKETTRVTIMGAGGRLGPGRVQGFSRMPTWIGEMAGGLSERVRTIARTFSEAGLETIASDDIVRDIWKKLLGNIAMSAVSGLTDLSSAESLAVPALERTCLAALDEAWAISTPGGTGDNKSSLCVDLLNRHPTEVDVIDGAVIDRGRALGVPIPTLNTLASLVKGLESRYLKDES